MDDPHVRSLHYRVTHSKTVSFEEALPVAVDRPAFSVRITGGEVTVDMKDHHASEQSARATVEPFLRAWELSSALSSASDEFKFVFERAHIIDRNPGTGTALYPHVLVTSTSRVQVDLTVVRAA